MPATKRKKNNKRSHTKIDQQHDSETTLQDTHLINGVTTTEWRTEVPTFAPEATSALKHHDGKKHRPLHKHKRMWFIGALSCVLGAILVQQANETHRMQQLLEQFHDLNLTLSSNFNASISDLLAHLPAFSLPSLPAVMTPDPAVGELLAQKGLRAKHTVVIVPGFVTTGLELWQGQPCAMKYFRQRMWGTLTMAQAFLLDKDCWFAHMALDPATGLDPPGVKIRASGGLEAVDYLMPGYWVFGRLVEALAAIGYDHNNMVSMPYDWRLAMPNLELRDAYFSRLKVACELHSQLSGLRVVLMSHSYGSTLVQAFLHWAEGQQAGWVEAHIESWANLAGPTLGLPKAVSALLSGEMRDTAQLMSLAAYLTDSMMMPRTRRAQLFRTWGSVLGMLPVGGPGVWGNASWAPDDDDTILRQGRSYGALIAAVSSASSSMRGLTLDQSDDISAAAAAAAPGAARAAAASGRASGTGGNITDDADQLGLRDTMLAWFSRLAHDLKTGSETGNGTPGNGSSTPGSRSGSRRELLSVQDVAGAIADAVGGQYHDHIGRWSAVAAPSPPAAGINSSRAAQKQQREDERSREQPQQPQNPSWYERMLQQPAKGRVPVRMPDPTTTPLPKAPTTKFFCLYGVGKPTERGYHYLKTEPGSGEGESEELPLWRINTLASHPESGLESGVQTSDGDGTVPLLSLGLMCYKGWRSKALNPAGLRVVTREYKHQPVAMYLDVRGGPTTADHVDILGNTALLTDVLHIAAGETDKLGDSIASDIARIAGNVPLWGA